MGLPEKPIAELTKCWWIIFSPGQKDGVTNMKNFVAQIVWLFKERHDDSNYVYEEF